MKNTNRHKLFSLRLHRFTQIYLCGSVFRSVLFCVVVLVGVLLPPSATAAEEKLTLSVTPPLFQLNIGPGEFWASSVRTINTNPYELTLYASVMNFEAQGETGQGKITPIVEEDPGASGNSLAHWIEISKDPIIVPRETSAEIPFSVRIPPNAPPGGHYAAILVGTRPLHDPNEGSSIRVSSLVSSLLFVRVRGEVIEEGNIREFLTDKTFYQEADVTFTLRFENEGNVHLKPQGDISIYNMWGKERGKLFINHKTNFGNVLPKSTRKFIFEWKGEENFFEAGRYKAVTVLTFGKEARQNVSRTTYFWVVPLKPILAILGSFILFLTFAVFVIRLYIKRSIAVVQREYGLLSDSTRAVVNTVVDLRKKSAPADSSYYEQGVKKRRFRFALYVLIFVLWLGVAGFYFQDVLKGAKGYEIIIKNEPKPQFENTIIILGDD